MIGNRIELERFQEKSGLLMPINSMPFDVRRVFYLTDVPQEAIRGKHFSKTSQFLYVVVKGSCKVTLDDGFEKEIHVLNEAEGLLFPKNIWMNISDFQKDTVLCVMSDTVYTPSDYSEDYSEFLEIARKKNV
jgi:dTDP-4-dehydrorhamnose 3,5-epimerase-like enzyme